MPWDLLLYEELDLITHEALIFNCSEKPSHLTIHYSHGLDEYRSGSIFLKLQSA
jgi:hypothetical protein